MWAEPQPQRLPSLLCWRPVRAAGFGIQKHFELHHQPPPHKKHRPPHTQPRSAHTNTHHNDVVVVAAPLINSNMPLLNKVDHPEGGTAVSALKPNDEAFLIRCSSELVKNYGDFVDKQHAYSLPQWQDKYYGRSKLTYYQALALEKSAEDQLRAQVRRGRGQLRPAVRWLARKQRDPSAALTTGALCQCSSPSSWREMQCGSSTTVSCARMTS